MKRFGLVVLTLAALGLGAADARTAAAQPVGYRSAADLVEVQYRPYHGSYRAERRAERRAIIRARERAAARRAYRAGRYSRY